MTREIHRVNGQLAGLFYQTTDGRGLYLLHVKLRQLDKRRHAWLVPEQALRLCRERGITAVGVICKRGGHRHVHLTHIDDFYGEDSFFVYGDTRMRGLPLKRFRIDPAKAGAVIAKAIKLR